MERDKAIGLFMLGLNRALDPFTMYGMGVHIPPAKDSIKEMALLPHERLSSQTDGEVASQG